MILSITTSYIIHVTHCMRIVYVYWLGMRITLLLKYIICINFIVCLFVCSFRRIRLDCSMFCSVLEFVVFVDLSCRAKRVTEEVKKIVQMSAIVCMLSAKWTVP